MLATTVALSIFLYRRLHGSIEYIEVLILILSIFLMVMSFIESFHWFVIFATNKPAFNTGCIAIAFFRQYFCIALLINVVCIAIHLNLQVCPPKCLQVIGNERKKKYRYLILLYLLLETTVPSLFVPWPFLKKLYGVDATVCWISECHGPSCLDDALIMKVLLWFMWPSVVALFLMISLIATSITLCRRTSVKFNANVVSLLILASVFIVVAVLNGIEYAINGVKNVFISQMVVDLPISAMWLICGLVLLGRIIYQIYFKNKRNYPPAHINHAKTPLLHIQCVS